MDRCAPSSKTPAGSRWKLAYDEEHDVFVASRTLSLGLSYPYDFGFVPGTLAPDGDPLDVMIYHDAPTYPGVVIPCRAIGVVCLVEKEKKTKRQNDRIIAVPISDRRYADARDLSSEVRKEIERFFALVVIGTKDVRIEGWHGPRRAMRVVDACVRARA